MIRENLDYNARRATALATAARCPAVAPGAARPARLRPGLRACPVTPRCRRDCFLSTGFHPAVCHLLPRRHRLLARPSTGSPDVRTSCVDRFQGNPSPGGEHADRLLLLPADAG